jgi:hypothetical protein
MTADRTTDTRLGPILSSALRTAHAEADKLRERIDKVTGMIAAKLNPEMRRDGLYLQGPQDDFLLDVYMILEYGGDWSPGSSARQRAGEEARHGV